MLFVYAVSVKLWIFS